MAKRTWYRPRDAARRGRDATLAQIIETIDRTAPQTKADLASEIGISEQYLSDLLQELKRKDVVRKAYTVDETAVLEQANRISDLTEQPTIGEQESSTLDGRKSLSTEQENTHRGTTVLKLLARLNEVTAAQYTAAHESFLNEEPERPATALESLANERYSSVLAELKSYTLTTDWPGNRVASDLASIATNFEIVGDRACFITDVIDSQDNVATGTINERISDVFTAGSQINTYLETILFDCDLSAHEDLIEREETIHRELDELFELITAYDPEMYAYLVTITRALERAIYYWVHASEIAIRLHTGLQPEHVMI